MRLPFGDRKRTGLHVLVCGVAFAALTIWSWNKWGDLFTDYGRNLCMTWLLALGKVMYRDFFHVYGPAPLYFDAFFFRLFGCNRMVLVLRNLAMVGVTTAILWRTVFLAADRLTATVASLVFLSVFAFSHTDGMGIYNFICPYSPEVIFGIQACVALIWILLEFPETHPRSKGFVAGLLAGLCLLAKPEPALAACSIAVATVWVSARRNLRPALQMGAMMAAGATVPVAVFFAYFCTKMPASEALKGTAGAWVLLPAPGMKDIKQYQVMLGVDSPTKHLLDMVKAWLRVAGLLGVMLLAHRMIVRWLPNRSNTVAVGVGLVTFAATVVFPHVFQINVLPRIVPAAVLLTIGATCWSIARNVPERRTTGLLLWAMFSLCMILRLFLNPRFDGYGFAMVMPGTILLVILGVYHLPLWAHRTMACGTPARVGVLALLAVTALSSLLLSQEYYSCKIDAVGTGANQIRTYAREGDERVSVFVETLEAIEATPTSATLVCFPEGELFNFLAQREPSTRNVHFAAAELAGFGDDAIIEDLAQNPPDYAMVVGKRTTPVAWGLHPRNGQRIMEWVYAHYRNEAVFGSEPFATKAFGIKLLKRGKCEESTSSSVIDRGK